MMARRCLLHFKRFMVFAAHLATEENAITFEADGAKHLQTCFSRLFQAS